MDRILELLGFALAGEITAEQQAELAQLLADEIGNAETRADGIADETDERLAEVQTAVIAAFDALVDADTPSLDLLTALADAREAIAAEDEIRQEASAEAQRAIDELTQRVHGATDSDTTGDSDGDEPEGVEGEGEGEGDGDEGDGEGDEPEGSTREPETVTAAGTAGARTRRASARRVPLGQINGRTAQTEQIPGGDDDSVRLLAGANLGARGVVAGHDVTVDQVAEAAADLFARQRGGTIPGRYNLATWQRQYPEERQLSATDANLTGERVGRVHESMRRGLADGAFEARAEALVAAGGLCGPLPARFEQDVLGTTERPVAAALPGFDMSRGGVRYVPSPTLADIGADGQPGDTDAAVSIWTMSDDEAADPSDPQTFKSIQRVECGSETSASLYLVVARLEVGNIAALTWPERVRAFITLASVAYARAAEQAALARIKALSTNVAGFSPVLGSARDAIAEFATGAYSLRTRNRVAQTTPVRVIAPEALRTSIIIDLVRQLPGDGAVGRAEAMLADALREINVVVTWTPDLIVPGAEAGTLAQVPTTIEYALFLDGTFDHGTGINIDLGFESGTPIRDSRLNAVNDYELFMEAGEQVVKFGGHQALWVTTSFCPSGSSAGSVEVTCEGS